MTGMPTRNDKRYGGDLPSTPHICRLRVHGIIPCPYTAFNPPLRIDRQFNLPQPPGIVVLCTHILKRNFIPNRPAISTDLHSHRPMSTARIRPAGKRDFPLVDNLIHIFRGDNRRAHRHVLDRKAIAILRILFPNLRRVIEIFLLLNGCRTRLSDGPDLIQPFNTPGSDIAKNQRAERISVNLG